MRRVSVSSIIPPIEMLRRKKNVRESYKISIAARGILAPVGYASLRERS
jgi:hypothetical protein